MEDSYYGPIKKILEKEFGKLGKCYFEITAKGKISNEIKSLLDDLALYIINVERFSPDIMGCVIKGFMDKPINEILSNKKELVVVEVKPKIKIKDIYQAKQYGEIFNAKYTLLIYIEPMPEEIRRFLRKRAVILSHSAGYQRVAIVQFDKETGKIKNDSWFGLSPFEEEDLF